MDPECHIVAEKKQLSLMLSLYVEKLWLTLETLMVRLLGSHEAWLMEVEATHCKVILIFSVQIVPLKRCERDAT